MPEPYYYYGRIGAYLTSGN